MSILKEAVEQINDAGPFAQLAFSIGFTAAVRELGLEGDLPPVVLDLVNRAEEYATEFIDSLPEELFG